AREFAEQLGLGGILPPLTVHDVLELRMSGHGGLQRRAPRAPTGRRTGQSGEKRCRRYISPGAGMEAITRTPAAPLRVDRRDVPLRYGARDRSHRRFRPRPRTASPAPAPVRSDPTRFGARNG